MNKRLTAVVLAAALAGALLVQQAPVVAGKPKRPTPISHVFIYVMENTNYADVYKSKEAPYLNSLIEKYAFATHYQATGHASLDNYIAMTSGQPPNPATSGDCLFYGTPFCIQDVDNIADQLEAAGYTWKGYMDAMEEPCQHTAENSFEPSQTGYTPRHNPFVYYRSIVDDQKRCDSHIVAWDELWKDMKARNVPNYSFLTPDTCHDGHDHGGACEEGGGVHEADWFAEKTVPRILADPSWKQGGLLVLTFDESGIENDDNPVSADNGSPDFGGHIFTLLVSPNVTPGTKLDAVYNHYGLLKTVEDIFCLDYLAGAGGPLTRSMIDALNQERCALKNGS
jgi:hypothetical protein